VNVHFKDTGLQMGQVTAKTQKKKHEKRAKLELFIWERLDEDLEF